MTLRLPEYDAASDAFAREVLNGFYELDPLFSKIGSETTGHRGPFRVMRGQQPIEQTLVRMEASTSLSYDALRQTDLDAITAALYELAESYLKATAERFFSELQSVSEAGGPTVDARGRPLSYDLINDALEAMDVDFNEEGKTEGLTVVVSPEAFKGLQGQEPTAEQRARLDEIMRRKKETHDAAKRHRRLPRTPR